MFCCFLLRFVRQRNLQRSIHRKKSHISSGMWDPHPTTETNAAADFTPRACFSWVWGLPKDTNYRAWCAPWCENGYALKTPRQGEGGGRQPVSRSTSAIRMAPLAFKTSTLVGDLRITSTSTERQKRSQNLAPVLVIISGNSLVFSWNIITARECLGIALMQFHVPIPRRAQRWYIIVHDVIQTQCLQNGGFYKIV